MSRQNKYRGKRIDNGKWVYGYLIGDDVIVGEIVEWDDDYFCTEFWLKVDPETVGQYTGLCDSNGKEIYEGDIIKITYDTNYAEHSYYVGSVKYGGENGYPAFDLDPWIDCEMNALSWLKSEVDESVKSYEVIGNVWEHPHLLQEGDSKDA